MSIFRKALLIAAAAWAPMAAQATASTATHNFEFYGHGELTDRVSVAPTFISGTVGVTIRAFDSAGKVISLAERIDGLGAYSGGGDLSEIDSLFSSGPGESLELTFNRDVKLDSLGFSLWENGFFGPVDQARLSWGSQSLTLGTNNDKGLLVKTFSFSGATIPQGTVFTITSLGSLSAFRLASIGVTPVAVPEPATTLLMGLGLAGLAVGVQRARRAR